MTDLKFQPTHRVLIVAKTGTHGYDMVTIDENNGTFLKSNVKASETKIRAKENILAEKLCYNGDKDYNLPLKESTALNIITKFNKKRAKLGFEPLEFWRLDANEQSS